MSIFEIIGSTGNSAILLPTWKNTQSSSVASSDETSYRGELSHVVERPQGIELLQGQDQSLWGWGVHEVKSHQVIDPETLKQQHNVAEIGTLDLNKERERENRVSHMYVYTKGL